MNEIGVAPPIWITDTWLITNLFATALCIGCRNFSSETRLVEVTGPLVICQSIWRDSMFEISPLHLAVSPKMKLLSVLWIKNHRCLGQIFNLTLTLLRILTRILNCYTYTAYYKCNIYIFRIFNVQEYTKLSAHYEVQKLVIKVQGWW